MTVYIPSVLDDVPSMSRKQTMTSLDRLEARYAQLRAELGTLGPISQGSVYRRPQGQPGNRFTWSTKVNAKTVSLALSEDQADWFEQAIDEHRRLKKILAEMYKLSRQIMRLRFPDPERRKPINKSVLRLI